MGKPTNAIYTSIEPNITQLKALVERSIDINYLAIKAT